MEHIKEQLIRKWLDDELSPEELEALKTLPEYEAYVRITESATSFNPPEFEKEVVFKQIEASKKPKKTKNRLYYYAIAATIAIVLGISTFFNTTSTTTVTTSIAQQKTIVLPDQSEVTLNAGSSITYDDKKWDKERRIELAGEAFFKVAKGEKFDVVTPQGTVSVLGTQFTVKDRGQTYEVQTFEGLVQVATQDRLVRLPAGQAIVSRSMDIVHYKTEQRLPSWLSGYSTFAKAPIPEVLDELQRQYDVKIQATNLPKDKTFTGSFSNTDLEFALQSIITPLDLKYTLEGKTISISE